MKNFNKVIDELYQLCRRAQEEAQVSVRFEVMNYKDGKIVTISIYDGIFTVETGLKMYDIFENCDEEENIQKVKNHLNQLLLNKSCLYCEVNEGGK